jgi:hypothetical protein
MTAIKLLHQGERFNSTQRVGTALAIAVSAVMSWKLL